MANEKRIRISDESINEYGTWVKTDGVDLTQYRRNPVLLQMHWRGYIIGEMRDIKVENGEITGVPYFDEVREESKLAKKQWDKGTLRMCSPNFDVLEMSEDPALLKPGQRRHTVTKSKLIEVSMVDIGGNDNNIVMLSYQGNGLQLSSGDDSPNLPLLNKTKGCEPIIDNKKNNEMKTIALKLGLPETATQDQILSKIGLLQEFEAANVTLRSEKETLQLAAITQVVEGAITARKINADKKDHFITLGKSTGIESLKLTFDAMSAVVKPTEMIPGSGGSNVGSLELGRYNKLSDVPADKLMQLRDDDKATYMKLYKAEYGVDCPSLS